MELWLQDLVVDDIRGISDEFSGNGNAASSFGLSNMVWGFGQFIGTASSTTTDLPHSPTCSSVHAAQSMTDPASHMFTTPYDFRVSKSSRHAHTSSASWQWAWGTTATSQCQFQLHNHDNHATHSVMPQCITHELHAS